MIQRALTPVLERFATYYPLVGITGPRQSGKTTLARAVFSHLPYVSLEDLETRFEAQEDPKKFLKRYERGAVFDEVQNAPDILSYLQQIVDESPETGRYVITGSENFALTEHVTQSLAGRIGMTTLLPLSMAELGTPEDITSLIFKGGYPRLYEKKSPPWIFTPAIYIPTWNEM